MDFRTSSAYYVCYKSRLSSHQSSGCLPTTPTAATVSHLANPEVHKRRQFHIWRTRCSKATCPFHIWRTQTFKSDGSFAFRERRRQKATTVAKTATSMRVAPRRERDFQHREWQITLVWPHASAHPTAQNAGSTCLPRFQDAERRCGKHDFQNTHGAEARACFGAIHAREIRAHVRAEEEVRLRPKCDRRSRSDLCVSGAPRTQINLSPFFCPERKDP